MSLFLADQAQVLCATISGTGKAFPHTHMYNVLHPETQGQTNASFGPHQQEMKTDMVNTHASCREELGLSLKAEHSIKGSQVSMPSKYPDSFPLSA